MEEKYTETELSKVMMAKRLIFALSAVFLSLILGLISFIIVKNIPSTSSRLIKYYIYLGVSVVNIITALIFQYLIGNIKKLVEVKRIISNIITGIFFGSFFAVIFCLIPLALNLYPFGYSLTLDALDVMIVSFHYLCLGLSFSLIYISLLQDSLEIVLNKYKFYLPIITGLLYAIMAFFFTGNFGIYMLFVFILGLAHGYQRLLFKTQNVISYTLGVFAFFIFIMIIRLVLI